MLIDLLLFTVAIDVVLEGRNQPIFSQETCIDDHLWVKIKFSTDK